MTTSSQSEIRDNTLRILASKLENIHRQGNELHAACPKCGGRDRFISTPNTEYSVWWCRQCQHTTTTAALAGLGWTATPRPAVKEWEDKPTVDPMRLERIREAYHSFVEFAQLQLIATPRAQDYLLGRGLDVATIDRAGLGYIDATSYRAWWASLAGLPVGQRLAIEMGAEQGGLPVATDDSPLRGFAAMFAGGRQGKIVFPYFDEAGHVVDLRTRSISPHDTIGGKPVRYTSPRLPLAERGAVAPYGVDALAGAGRVILTEGEFKRLVPLAAGLPWPVLSLRGTSDPVVDYLPWLRGRFVVLAFDNDTKRDKRGLTAGESATVTVGRLLRAHGVDVGVMNPQALRDQKGIDDFVVAYGVDALASRAGPGASLTLPEFEAMLTERGADLSGFVDPKSDVGTVKQWTPAEHVDTLAHADVATVTLEEAQELIKEATNAHWSGWKRGHDQILVSTTPGTGKTTITLQTAKACAGKTGEKLAYIAPNHAMIDEKIADGTLPADTIHVYGRRWDDEIQNCEQADTALTLQRYGYSPGAILCPECPFRGKCEREGYKSQFKGKAHRAYVHAHLHTDYPAGEDLVIVDELTHKTFVDGMAIFVGDIANALQSSSITGGQRAILEAILNLYTVPNLADVGGAEFYELLQRFYAELPNVDVWGDGWAVQMALNDIALEFSQDVNPWAADQLPQQFAAKLFSILSEDVRRLQAGQTPTGRVRFVCPSQGDRRLVLTYSKGSLPGWYGKRPTVILNATADAATLNDLIGPIKVVAPAVAVKEGNEIVQDVTRNNAKSGLMGDSPNAQKRRAAWLAELGGHIVDEEDTVIVTTKALAGAVSTAYSKARVTWYGALEGRNDLQAGTTILANAPAVNVRAVLSEAAALYPGIDTTLTRAAVAFDEQNAGGEYLAVEQMEAADPRVQALLWQHRDAAVVQAVHRARLVRESGRRVVVLFSRPIPGLPPTQTIVDRQAKASNKSADTFERILTAARILIDQAGAFSRPMLMAESGAHHTTIERHWDAVTKALRLNWFDLPATQTLANGARRSTSLRVAIPEATVSEARLHVARRRYENLLIALARHVQCCVPDSWDLDLPVIFASEELQELFRRRLTEEEGAAQGAYVFAPAQIPPDDDVGWP